jgi:hypothetical protein
MKRKEAEDLKLLYLPCLRNGCGWTGTVSLRGLDYMDENKQERYKLEYIRRTMQDLVRGHENGDHKFSQPVHSHFYATPCYHCCCGGCHEQ